MCLNRKIHSKQSPNLENSKDKSKNCRDLLYDGGKPGFDSNDSDKTRLDSPLIADSPPANSTTLHSRLGRRDRPLCFGGTAYLPGSPLTDPV